MLPPEMPVLSESATKETTTLSDHLLSALRRRFRTPQEAMRTLGLDAAEIHNVEEEFNMPKYSRRLARDQFDPNAAGEVCDQLRQILDSLPEEEAQRLFGRLVDIAEEYTLGRDQPAPFSGRPRPGGEMDPITDRRVEARRQAADGRRLALDSGDEAYRRRWPNAARIGIV